MGFEFGGEIAWRPTFEGIEHSRLTAFMRAHGLDSLSALMERSTRDIAWFWGAVMDDLGIEFYEPYTRVVDVSQGIALARWCVGGRMNIVHNCLEKWTGSATEDRPAVHWEGEEGLTRTLTYGELLSEVNRAANGLRAIGLARGDRVALFMPMCPELVVAFFAVIKMGGIVLPLFSGYGSDAVATRLLDAGASLIITADGFWRRGQAVRMKETADAAIGAMPQVRHLVVVPRLGIDVPAGSRDVTWADLLRGRPDTCDTVRTEADEPLMIIYTSGTTGRPKGAVHSHCGFPVKTAQDMAHCFDVRPGDTMYWVKRTRPVLPATRSEWLARPAPRPCGARRAPGRPADRRGSRAARRDR
jgi:acetyl-CoA synthetase